MGTALGRLHNLAIVGTLVAKPHRLPGSDLLEARLIAAVGGALLGLPTLQLAAEMLGRGVCGAATYRTVTARILA